MRRYFRFFSAAAVCLLLGLGLARPVQAAFTAGTPLTPVFDEPVRGPYQHAMFGSSVVEANGNIKPQSFATLTLPADAAPALALLNWYGTGFNADTNVTLVLPDGTNVAVSADPNEDCLFTNVSADPNVSGAWFWHCVATVTDQTAALSTLSGTYQMRDFQQIDVGPPYNAQTGSFADNLYAGGWTMTYVYVDPADTYPRSLQIAMGLWASQRVAQEVARLPTPFEVGPNGGRLSMLAIEGDVEFPPAGGCTPGAELPVVFGATEPSCDFVFLCDGFCSTQANQLAPLANAANPLGNIFNETISSFEPGLIADVTLTNGSDIDGFSLADAGLTAGRVNDLRVGVQTGGDLVLIAMLVLEVEDFDADGDGLSNFEEQDIWGTDQTRADTDGDGIPDGVEAYGGNPADPRNNLTDPRTADSDQDGLCDGNTTVLPDCVAGEDRNQNGIREDTESDPFNADSDEDGLTDGQEVLTGNYEGRTTSPIDADSDDDGLADGFEDANRDGLRDANETDPTLADTDGDGLRDGLETTGGSPGNPANRTTDPLNPDTDGDGLCDGSQSVAVFMGVTCVGGEDQNNSGFRTNNETDPTVADTDGDGLDDGFEVREGAYTNGSRTSAVRADTDGDGLCDGDQAVQGVCVAGEDRNENGRFDPSAAETDPTLADTDNGGESDGSERNNGRNPVDFPEDDNGRLEDPDADGLNTGTEIALGTNPNDPDSDDDGLNDGIEVNGPTGTDPLDSDSDDDGLSDGLEDRNANGVLDEGETHPNQADTDGDGLCDGAIAVPSTCFGGEDQNASGSVDEGETDPRNPDSDADGLSDGLEVLDGNYTNGKTDPLNPDTDGDGERDGNEDLNTNGVFDPGETDPTVFDRAEVDAGPVDAGSEDAGPEDAGEVDAGPQDAGPKPPPAGFVSGSSFGASPESCQSAGLGSWSLLALGWLPLLVFRARKRR